MTSVHLVRHGQSTWNLAGRLQGQTGHPELTAQGRAEAGRAAANLAALINDAPCTVMSSDLVRSRQTADLIAASLGVSVIESTALREQHLGELQGRLTSELEALPVPEGLDISEVRWGGGESIADVHTRLADFFDRILPGAPAHLVLVTHGDTLRVALAVLAGRCHREVEWSPIPNGAIRSVPVSFDPNTAAPSDRVDDPCVLSVKPTGRFGRKGRH